jgi:hypothetical protein
MHVCGMGTSHWTLDAIVYASNDLWVHVYILLTLKDRPTEWRREHDHRELEW